MPQDVLQQTYDVIVVGSGATGGWAAKAARRSRTESRAARSGPRGVAQGIHRAHAGLQAQVSRPLARNRTHAPGAEAVLRLHGIQLRVVRQRPGKSLQHARGQAVHAGSACALWADARWSGAGRAIASATPISRPPAATATATTGPSPTPTSRPTTTSSSTTSASAAPPENNEMLPDGQFLPPMKMSCGEVRLRERVKAKFGRTVTIGRVAILTQNHNGRARLPLLRSLRTRLQHLFLLQQSVHHREGRGEVRQLHADHERRGQPRRHGRPAATRRGA